jgi:AAA domain
LVFHFGSAPLDALKQVEPLIVETQARLLIIDVLQKFCRLRDLNDYAQVTNTLEPLMSAARKQGCHILLTHHAGKADRPDGDDILGSTGLLGGVDTSIHIKKRDKRRTFFTIQRYGEDTPETVIQLTEAGSLESIGSREEVEVEQTEPLIIDALRDGGSLAVNDLCETVEKRKALVLKALGWLTEKGQLTKSGSGKKGDPYKYSVLVFPNTNGNGKTEFKSADNPSESKEECCSGLFRKNEKVGNSMGTAFSAQENRPKEASFSPEIYTAEDRLEEERYIREERAGIEDEDGFEDLPESRIRQ